MDNQQRSSEQENVQRSFLKWNRDKRSEVGNT
nr:MAG TPA: hypothetical protein [Caudoviricetes sp.]